MIQTGCPLGTGTGGESIWGGEFEDEIVPELRVCFIQTDLNLTII
jgi:peptidylprolyl isomerase domain and WD repeat-containing protein 1